MTHDDAKTRLDLLLFRIKNSLHVVGVLTADEDGIIGLTMMSDDNVDLTKIGVSGQRKAGGI